MAFVLYFDGMSLSICSFASGSKGNCTFVSSGSTKILIDGGISVKNIEQSLSEIGESTADLSILVTHAHIDHIRDVPAFALKHDATVYAHHKTASVLRHKMHKAKKDTSLGISLPTTKAQKVQQRGQLVPFGSGDFFVGDITVSPFEVSHDIHCLGYSLYHQGSKITIVTDLGCLPDELLHHIKDSDLVLLESNHNKDLLDANPNYSPWLKQRILSKNGHLSNYECALAAATLVRGRTKNIILGHLSQENNYPELAFSEVCALLASKGIKEGRDVIIDVAKPCSIEKMIRVQ